MVRFAAVLAAMASVLIHQPACAAETLVYTQREQCALKALNGEGARATMLPNVKLTTPILVMLAISAAQAHVTVQPRESTAGAVQKYTMRVPNERNVPNVRIEAEFPAAVEIISVDEKAGWTIGLKKDSSGKITAAVWSGASIAPRDLVEFGISARNPNDVTKLIWKVVQIYEDGTRSEWTGPEGSRGLAPVTQIKPR